MSSRFGHPVEGSPKPRPLGIETRRPVLSPPTTHGSSLLQAQFVLGSLAGPYDSDDLDDPIVTSTLRHRDDPDISDMDVLLMSRDVGIGERCIMVTRSRIYIRQIG